ncbi:MAG TPA: hypothetical protein EYP57_06230, partial [Thermodesulfobacteriaceae bacterium]|nr:hypothetical protein [Thermodesulfobacteriaceae bacterium]
MKPASIKELRLKNFDKEHLEANRRRCEGAALILFLCFVIFCARLWHLQIVRGPEFRKQSEINRIKTVRLQPPRGKILDRTGRLLAGIKPNFNVCLVREDIENMEELLAKLCPILGESEAVIRTSLHAGSRRPKYVPIVIKRGLDWET